MERIARGRPLKSILVDGSKVRLFAETFGVSLREIARRMGCSHVYLLQVLDGRKSISTRFAPRLTAVLGDIARSVPLNPFAFVRETVPPSSPSQGQDPLAPSPLSALVAQSA